MSIKSLSRIVLSLALLAGYILATPATHAFALSDQSGNTSTISQGSDSGNSNDKSIEIEKEKADIEKYTAQIQKLEIEKLHAESQNQLTQADKIQARINKLEVKIHKLEDKINHLQHP